MKAIYLGAILAAGLAGGAAAATAGANVMAPINQFMEGFAKGDMKLAGAAQTEDVTIVDEFSPHTWTAPGAFAAWGADLGKYEKSAGVADDKIVLGVPIRREITGDHAYVVAPAVYTFKQKGVAMHEPAARMTFALLRGPAGWKIAAWTWTSPRATPVAK